MGDEPVLRSRLPDYEVQTGTDSAHGRSTEGGLTVWSWRDLINERRLGMRLVVVI